MKKKVAILLIIPLILLLILDLFWIRAILPREIDDVSPLIPCEEEYIEKADILWVVPRYDNISISNYRVWCEEIRELNKTLGLHGVYHTYNEFQEDKNQEYIQEGIKIFDECFGEKPGMFKPPHLKISEENKGLVEENGLELKSRFNQVIHKVYHCDDSGKLPNWVIDWI